MQEQPRSLRLFEVSIKSPKTLKLYKAYLNQFLTWSHKDHESLLLLPNNELQTLLMDYVMHLRKTIGYSAINVTMSAIGKFLDINDKEYKQNKIRMLMPEKKKLEGKQAYSTKQIQELLKYADTKRDKAIIHSLSAGGFRDGALENLKWKHIEPIGDNCYSVLVYAGSTHEYITFLHQEARKALDEYTDDRIQNGETITKESLVFAQYKKISRHPDKPIIPQSIAVMITRTLERAGIERLKADSGKRYNISITNGFRKRFNTILKSNASISYAIAERMMDHKNYMESHYLDTSDITKYFEEYKKAIPELILDDSERLRLQNEAQSKIIKKAESEKDLIVKDYGERLSNSEKIIKELAKRLDMNVE